jgi:excisionase family DNA binding protein
MEEFVTVEQLARAVGVHPLTIRRHIKKGTLQAVRIGRNVRITMLEAEAFTERMLVSRAYSQGKEPLEKVFTIHDPLFQLVQPNGTLWDQIVIRLLAALKKVVERIEGKRNKVDIIPHSLQTNSSFPASDIQRATDKRRNSPFRQTRHRQRF